MEVPERGEASHIRVWWMPVLQRSRTPARLPRRGGARLVLLQKFPALPMPQGPVLTAGPGGWL